MNERSSPERLNQSHDLGGLRRTGLRMGRQEEDPLRPKTTEGQPRKKGAHLERYGDDPLVYKQTEGVRMSVWKDKRTITELQQAWEDHRAQFEEQLMSLMSRKKGL
mmetsp:Transcript_55505/g.136013  ORF Transcript_55505/g.136013 Transcript_55505/m.136013 type:complete len:106 (-) Transcript_55505:200-517(-)